MRWPANMPSTSGPATSTAPTRPARGCTAPAGALPPTVRWPGRSPSSSPRPSDPGPLGGAPAEREDRDSDRDGQEAGAPGQGDPQVRVGGLPEQEPADGLG